MSKNSHPLLKNFKFQILGIVILVFGLTVQSHAQFLSKWLAVGSYQNYYNAAGAEKAFYAGGNPHAVIWPAIYRAQHLQRQGALWVATQNFTDENGKTWPARIAHVGPRTTGLGEVFVQDFIHAARFQPPTVTVDGLETFQNAVVIDEIDPSIQADQELRLITNNIIGIRMEKIVKQFSQQYHENYHIREYTFTNTGNVDDDPDIELPNQTLEGVYIYQQYKRSIREGQSTFGNLWDVMHDWVGDGMQEYPDTDFRANFTWKGNSEGSDIDPLGGPIRFDSHWAVQEGDTVGRLGDPHFPGVITLHADQSVDNNTDDFSQPTVTGYLDTDEELMTTGEDGFNEEKMIREYEVVAGSRGADGTGHMYPHHADVIDQDGDFTTADGRPRMGLAGGIGPFWAYGPYTLEPGESIRIIEASAAAGLDRYAAVQIGKGFKASGWDPEAPITYKDETMGKNDWFFTGKDSIMQTFRRIKAAYENNYEIPQPPLPPSEFHVISGVDAINLEWDIYENADPQGFEIWRTDRHYEGNVENDFQYELIAELGPNARTYEDSEVQRGINYYYYIVSVGDVSSNDGSAMTPITALRSNRYYAQTYDPATLKRSSGESLSDVRVVPNPFNIESDPNVRWPDIQDKLAFLEIPGNCTIKIYTEKGELVETIEHTDGSGDEFWDLATSSRQVIVSGVYLAIIKDNETGDQIIRKFVIIH